MARGRIIAKSLGSSRKFASLAARANGLGEFAQALYPLLVASADDYGRQAGDAFTVKYAVFPTSQRGEQDFAAVLQALNDVGLIQWYQAAGKQVIAIVDFDQHQGLRRRIASKFLPLSTQTGEVSRTEDSAARYDNDNDNDSDNETKKSAEPLRDSTPEDAPVLVYPTVGSAVTTWQLSEAQVAEWATLFPGLDVVAEARKALAWIQANPNRRKTRAGMLRFLVGWLSRANDGRGSRRESRPAVQTRRSWREDCRHEPTCQSYDWHLVVVARERGEAV